MALQSDRYMLHPVLQFDGGGGLGTMLIDAAAEKAAVIFRVPKGGNISKVYFRLGTVTTGDTLKVSLQDVDTATGMPDGTADQSGTVVVADSDDNTWKNVTFGAVRAVTMGERLSCVIEYNAYVAGNLNINRMNAGPFITDGYTSHFTAAWAKSSDAGILVVEYDDTTYGVMLATQPFSTAQDVFNVDSVAADEIGIKFTLPFACKLAGIVSYMTQLADFQMVLYDSNGTTVMESASFVAAVTGATGVAVRMGLFATTPQLLPNTAYRAVIKPTTVSNVTVRYGVVSAAAHLAQCPGGTDFIYTSRVNAGAWTDVNTQRPYMSLLLSALSDDEGGSSGWIIGG